ncbi:hypothetical protein SAMN05444920_107475 [Nonomuraea solani]|uniref:DUF732 domain-containing protein n=1 Tax=Nonomuraea solani TaxID=1144553 RepID=A0A1H6E3R2_9ACTN|nr:hypothetical protein [Nonomuraea solani]SEG92217.1 hypothetical protein SAMN05444920_107475 [Nonomuraea solani]
MTSLMKKLMVAVAAAALAGSGVAAAVALPASAGVTDQRGALFDGFAKNIDENVALAEAEAAARQNALEHGFTECNVFESVTSQNARGVWFAVVAVLCQARAA